MTRAREKSAILQERKYIMWNGVNSLGYPESMNAILGSCGEAMCVEKKLRATTRRKTVDIQTLMAVQAHSD